MKSRVRCALIATFAVVVLFAGNSSANHSWGGYHWARTANPFILKVGDNVSGAWDLAYPNSILDTTISDWSVSTVLDLTRAAGQANPRNCRPTAGRVEVCNSTYGNTGWLGVAQIWITGGTHITQGTVKLNDTYFNTATYNTVAWRNLVSCQEVGHTLGLNHQDENFNNANLNTCMDYTSDPASDQHPNQHDYDELVTIYSHLDSTTTVGAKLPSSAPGAMSDLAADGPGQWGRLVSSSRNGRSQTYELDFGQGNKIATHVFWADPAGDGRGR
jgi:hypothetical protein